MILHLHHRYRIAGGEERAVDDLIWLTRTHLHEDAARLTRDSASVSGAAAAAGLIGGGLAPRAVADAVRRTGARIVHAHNLHPTFGWRALAAARAAGARVVLHLHQYRLVCAIGVCFRDGAECTRCHGANTLPGLVRNCRGSAPEALAYAAGLALAQPRLAALVDAFVVPSRFAAGRLHALGAPVHDPQIVPNLVRALDGPAPARPAPTPGTPRPALVVGRLAAEKGIEVAIDACRLAGLPLIVAGEGPERERLRGLAGPDVTFRGRLSDDELRRLRAEAALALVPSRAAETFGLAAAEAMAAGLPVAASRVGALPELVPERWLADPGDARGLASAIGRVRADPAAAGTALSTARAHAAPAVAAAALAAVYERVAARPRPGPARGAIHR